MMLSDQQMAAVVAGVDTPTSWEIIERPEGPQPIPEWCKDAAIDWMEGYANRPSIHLKVTDGAREWNGVPWKKIGDRYVLEHWDGRVRQYGHDGAVFKQKLRRWRRFDGTIHQYLPQGDLGKHVASTDPNYKFDANDYSCWPDRKGEWVDVEMRATTKQQGFGGSEIELMMDDGVVTVLRGPWHIGAPAGFTEVTVHDHGKLPQKYMLKHKMKWWQRGGSFGFFIRTDVIVAILARFQPHLELAELRRDGFSPWVEPVQPNDGLPKTIAQDIRWKLQSIEREIEKQRKAAS